MKTDLRFSLVLACFVLSGLAGLIYQTAWTRQFAIVFGTTELALVTVLAAYMGGLALGAAASGRWASRVQRPVLVYGVLELGIGVTAVLVPSAIRLASRFHIALLGGGELPPESGSVVSALFYVVSSFTILLVPTGLMGATLPLLARWAVRSDEQIGSRIGLLYTANTAGAAAGALIAVFALLPRLGLNHIVLTAAGINVAVFALAALLARATGHERIEHASVAGAAERLSGRGWILPLILVSGAVSFSWEILWTRLLSQLVGGSVYAFATMLATFLIGLALGSAVAARFASTVARARSGFAAAQIGIGVLSLGAFAVIDRMPRLVTKLVQGGDHRLVGSVPLSAVILLPAAIAIGATFPFAVRCLAANAADAARASARVFAWNTVGAIVGALATGYLALPALGFANMAAVAAGVSLALALITAVVVRPRRVAFAVASVIGLLFVFLLRPDTPWALLRMDQFALIERKGEVAYHAVGRSGTVLLLARPSLWTVTVNGLPEAGVEPAGRPGNMVMPRWLSLLAVAARPQTSSLLVVGLGAGVTVEDIPASVTEIHVVELEPAVIEANRRMAEARQKDPLADPRLHLHVNDARGALRLTGQRFDAIVSQPSHPWTSGASNLFSREFVELVRDRLEPDGVFVQWMGLGYVDETLLRSFVATAVSVFPHVEVYVPDETGILLLASREPIEITETAKRVIEDSPADWNPFGVFRVEDILATRVLDAAGAEEFAATGRPNTDSRNLFQTRSPKIPPHGLGARGAAPLWAPHEPLVPPAKELDALYLVRRLIRRAELDRAERVAGALNDSVERLTAKGLVRLARGDVNGGLSELRQALDLDPENREALSALVALHRGAILRGEPVPVADGLSNDPEAAVVQGWRHSGAGQLPRVRALDERLATAAVRHPLIDHAIRLRATWRVGTGDPELAAEALAMLEPILGHRPRQPDLLLRAQAAAVAGNMPLALASLNEASADRTWYRILSSLSLDETTEGWREELMQRARRKTQE